MTAFTGKERDAETGLDYFGARYMSAAQGRFTSPDPFNILTDARDRQEFDLYLSNPQNWNRYKYGLNHPLGFVDPTGLKEVSAQDCQAMGSSCITVALNVIVDPAANVSQQAVDAQINAAKSFYGDANIHFEVSQVSPVSIPECKFADGSSGRV